MFRFINTYTQFNLSTVKYFIMDIMDKKYLIESPPTRPTLSFALFIKEQTTGISGLKATEKMAELAKKWAQNPQFKEKHEKQSKKNQEQYQKLSSIYQKKYPSIHLIGVSKYPPEEDRSYRVYQTKEIRDAKQVIMAQFIFPPKYYMRIYEIIRQIAQFQQDKLITKEKAYKKWEAQWQQKVAKWLKENGYDLSIQDFVKLHKKAIPKTKSQLKLIDLLKKKIDPSPTQTLKVSNSKTQTPVDSSKKKTKKGAVSTQ